MALWVLSSSEMPPERCGSCDEIVKRTESSLVCSACKKKTHQSCTDLSEAEAKILQSRTKLKWYCHMCDPDITEILANFHKFKKVSNEIAKMKTENEKRLKEFESRISACEASKVPRNVEQVVQNEVNRKSQLDREEEKLIEMKKTNIVYFNVPESNDESLSDRVKFDYEKLKEIHEEDMIKHTDIQNIFRVGKKQENLDRPLIVRFKSVEIKNEVLKQTADLKLRWNNEMRRIYASIDRTEKQRKEHSKLVKELKDRKEAGEVNLGIRDEKIVQIFRNGNAAPKVTFADLFRR